ncbi:MAG: hypothetical protein QNK89_04455 [Lacinutrix sp.]|uniref:RNA polymerase sigma factor n=1 Tax=Lacinutrix sp. TaxID=1937692 RepID=UPI0030AA0E96
MLEILHKYNRLWIKYVLELGCNIDTAKDIVQEFYLKMHDKETDYIFNKDQPNFYGCYVILRNMVFDLKRKEKRFIFETEESINESSEEAYSETEVVDKIECVFEWIKENDIDLDSSILNASDMKKLYFSQIFQDVFLNNVSISALSRHSNIGYFSLRNTVLLIKEEIKNKYENRELTRKNI